MAGHSKWANIRHRKGAQDAKRGKIFTKLIREISVAAKAGPDPSNNPSLRSAIDKALGANMKKDTIENTIKKATGGMDGVGYEEIRYEGYGPGGAAVIADCMTDNRNRTAAEVRHAFTKYGGNLGTAGSVAYLFSKQGVISFEAGADEDAVMEAALDAGAEDVISNDDGSVDVMAAPEDFEAVRDALRGDDLEPVHAEITFTASTEATLGAKEAETMLKMIDLLEDLDDVQEVYSNADIPQEVLDSLAAE